MGKTENVHFNFIVISLFLEKTVWFLSPPFQFS